MSAAESPAVLSLPRVVARRWQWMGGALLLALLALFCVHVVGAFQDFATAVCYPFELDYGEGIVWQQGALIPGPHMYSTSTDLPFIVFQYPPLYYLMVHAIHVLLPDYLAAGRLVAALSTVPLILSVSGMVLLATRRDGQSRNSIEIAIAIATGALVLCLHAFHEWGMFMRVDLPAVALAMLGLLVASWARGGFRGTTLALLLCAAAVFTRQTELPAGIAVFSVALFCRPRNALGAAAIAGGLSVLVLVALNVQTSGGFLLNTVTYNLNPMTLGHAYWPFWRERSSFLAMILMPFAFCLVCASILRPALRRSPGATFRQLAAICAGNGPVFCRAVISLDFLLVTLGVPTIMKAGSNYNYLQDWLAVGCILIGIALVDLWRNAGTRWMFVAAASALFVMVAVQPLRLIHATGLTERLPSLEAVVRRIAAASKPVASEDMVLLMRAGKPVMFEPVTATNLANLGVWDERPLVQMIRSGGFAFMLTRYEKVGDSLFRSAAVDAAMREAYPRVERVGPRLWLHLPPT